MSRNITSAMQTAISGKVVRPALFFEGVFNSGVLRLCSLRQNVVMWGLTWTGAGTVLGISNVAEGNDVTAAGITVQLSGIPTSVVSACIADAKQGKLGRVYLGTVDANGTIVDAPSLLFSGYLDIPNLEDGKETCRATITYESRLTDLRRPREWRYTDQIQKFLYPGDKGLEYVAVIQDQDIPWGRKA